MDGVNKMPIFVRPTIASCLDQGIHPVNGYRCIASWVVYARRTQSGACPVPYEEPYWDMLAPLIQPGSEATFARSSALWSDLPDRHAGFVPDVVAAIQQMDRQWPE